jgi:hypothetical protein
MVCAASTFAERVQELVQQYRVAAGAGVVLATPFGRVEVRCTDVMHERDEADAW